MNLDLLQAALKISSAALSVLAVTVSVIGSLALRKMNRELLKERSKMEARRSRRPRKIEGLGEVLMMELSTASKVERGRVAGLVVGPQLSTDARGIDSVMAGSKQLMSPSVKELAHG